MSMAARKVPVERAGEDGVDRVGRVDEMDETIGSLPLSLSPSLPLTPPDPAIPGRGSIHRRGFRVA